MYDVKNVFPGYSEHKYTVIRDCNNEQAPNNGYWYWCSYDNLILAQEALNEIRNGLIVESEEVNPISYDRW